MQHLDEHLKHLDEGTVHAWLDGALSPDESARVERHVATCAQCAALVAEARGLMAGASRILSALDDTPAVAPTSVGGGRRAGGEGARPVVLRPPPPAPRPLWSRPQVLAAAASLVLVAGTALILDQAGEPTSRAVSSGSGTIPSQTTENAVDLPRPTGAVTPVATTGVGSANQDAAAAGAAAAASAPAPTPAPERFAPARRRDETRAAPSVRPPSEPAPQAPVVRSERTITESAVTFSAPAQKAAPAAPPVPAPAAATDQARRLAPSPRMQLSEVIVTGAGTDTAASRGEITRGAVGRRAAAPGAAAPQVAARADAPPDRSYGDTVYTKGRTDTVFIERPRPLELRGDGRVAPATRPLPVTGCYEVIEGGLPKLITLTADLIWSGVAEHAFKATAQNHSGYWSQPSTGNIHLVIARAVVTARIDLSTGELRGKVQRGRKVEPFLARRCK